MTRTTRLLGLLVVGVLLLGSCGDDADSGSTTTSSTASTSTTGTEDTTTTTEAAVTVVSVYWFDGETLRVGNGRSVEGLGVAAAAVEELLRGPSADEDALGLGTAIPEGTELLGVNIVDDTATVDLSGEFASGGGTLSMNARLAQVVYTVTQFPSVRAVEIWLDGEPVESLGGEGLLLERPLTRADFEFGGEYEHLTPAILVETPRPGDEVGASFEVAGRANTFEATVNFEVVDRDGEVLVDELFTTATSGTGTPGDFAETIELPADVVAGDEIVLLAFERSAEDGERINVVEIPLVVAS